MATGQYIWANKCGKNECSKLWAIIIYYFTFQLNMKFQANLLFAVFAFFFFNSVVAYYQHCSMLDSDYET